MQVSLVSDVLEGEQLVLPVSAASRLVLSSAAFAQQWVAAGGLAPACLQKLLRDTHPPTLLVDALLVSGRCCCCIRERGRRARTQRSPGLWAAGPEPDAAAKWCHVLLRRGLVVGAWRRW